MLLELLFLENYVMSGAFGEHCPFYQVVFIMLIILCITNMGGMWKGHHY
jgi:hypothetical protein